MLWCLNLLALRALRGNQSYNGYELRHASATKMEQLNGGVSRKPVKQLLCIY